MSTGHSSTSANDLPIAESTKIQKYAKTPLKRLRLTLANRFGFHSNSNSPNQTPPPKRNPNNSLSLNKLDPKIYLDTQSNGFASRVVKYHEASEAKSREIANKTYRRLGDFPIVNLDKSEINLNQKQANTPKVAKISIAPPINLVSASARSTIFRTGKNYGDSYPIGSIDKIGPIEGRKPLRTTISQDEPIVPSTSDYDGDSARSSLEALKEISRKRIHCDEIDSEVNKKQRGENAQDECDSNSVQTPVCSKRTRDRISPSYCSSSNEVQKKRYKNNDILSSLSSSILVNTPKRKSLNIDATPTQIAHYREHERSATECTPVKQKTTDSSRVGTSNSDLPLQRPMEQIKPVIKSVSDGHLPKSEISKTPKLTLFNKDYSQIPIAHERTIFLDDDDDYSVSFVKPKTKTSTLFSGSRNRDRKSKLQIMLSALRGDESKDEVDSARNSTVATDDGKSNKKNDPKVIVSSSPSANLCTNTSVTFSTATTTSVLNVPSDAVKMSLIEVAKVPNKDPIEVSKTAETISTPSVSLVTAISVPVLTLPISSAPQDDGKNEKPPISETVVTAVATPATSVTTTTTTPVRTVTFNLPTAQQATATSLNQTTTSSDTVPRLGGFCFSATSTSFTLPTIAKPTTTENSSVLKSSVENQTTTPTISFGMPQSTGSGSALPTFTSPIFGSNTLIKPEIKNTATTQSNQTASAPPTFTFGSSVIKPTLAANTTIGFGMTSNPNSSVVSTVPGSLGTGTPSMFTFGATANTTASVPSTIGIPITTNANTTSFAFGSNVPSTSTPTFGFSNTAAIAVTTAPTSLPTLNQPKPLFSFGTTANPTKPETGTFQFGNATSTKTPILTFGSVAATTSATPSTGLFGNIITTNTSTSTQSAFTFTANKVVNDTNPPQFGTPTTKPAGLGVFSSPAPAFGQMNAAAAATATGAAPPPYSQTNSPSFGSVTNAAATTTNSTGFFGNSSTAQNTPLFGSNNTSAVLPKVENTFGSMSSNQNTSTPVFGSQNQASSSAFGSPMNTPAFGSTGNVFGSASITQNQPTFGTGAGLFSTPTTTQSNNNAFGSSGVFAFGQNSTQSPATTTAASIFGSPNTNASGSSPFVFGQSANNMPTQNQSSGIFGAKPADNQNTNSALSAPPSFGGTSPAFNFTAKPATFSFNASNTPSNVPAFGSSSTPPQFAGSTGNTNGLGTSFSFNASNNSAEAKPFAFGGPATAPAATPAPFSFNAPAQNAFQFNAQQPAAANIFSIGPSSGTNTTKTGRPMRTATRRIK